MQCQKALQEAGGDMKKALAILKKASADIALKKSDRTAKDGRVCIKTEGKKSVLVALHSETDFVSKNEDFINLLSKLADKAFQHGVSEMRKEAKEMINPVIQKTGEKIELGETYEVEGNILGNYVHHDKSAVIVSLEGGDKELAKDIAMHITAMKPEYISENDIKEDAKKTMADIFQKEIAGIDKPEEIKRKILEGKISTYFREKTLLDQPFIKNPAETVGQLLKKNKAEIREVKRYSI
ncbi:MAG: Elongation factor Ts [Parcubacteria group bacterium GW2011_GWF2_38_8]|nr:MAG: Elongation factor Ts [Parcubacteria group bacterium GW2011_GWF2_38_8]